MRFRPENGMGVTAFGSVSVYPRDGAYQLYCTELAPEGMGDLFLAFEQLKEKLHKEGLFAASHKKALPRMPARIAVITSPAGAAVRDIIRVLGKRWPMAKVIILPVRVQGAEAPPEIISAINYANKHDIADLIITGRGGGSMEDLWPSTTREWEGPSSHRGYPSFPPWATSRISQYRISFRTCARRPRPTPPNWRCRTAPISVRL
jgi:exodeoxyribonuclease VII large subunit